MTSPYPGGLPPPRPDQSYLPSGAPIAPGSQTGKFIGQFIILFGPSGAVVGIFAYQMGTTPGLGNPPVLSFTMGTADPYGNPVQQGEVSYGSGGSYSQLLSGVLNFVGAGGQFSPARIGSLNTAGLLDLTSGLQTNVDTPAEFTLQSLLASGIATSEAILNAGEFSVNANTLFSGTVNIPAGDGPFIQGETQHSVSLAGGLSGSIHVMKMPWNQIALEVDVSWATTSATTFTCGSLPDATYYPPISKIRALGINGTPSGITSSDPRVFIPTSGGLQIIVPSSSGGGSGGASVLYSTQV